MLIIIPSLPLPSPSQDSGEQCLFGEGEERRNELSYATEVYRRYVACLCRESYVCSFGRHLKSYPRHVITTSMIAGVLEDVRRFSTGEYNIFYMTSFFD